MSCALRKNRGSGYVKESGKDTLNPALEALKASRDAQVNRLFPPLAGSAVTMQPLASTPSTSCTAPILPISQIPLSRPQ
jgi:hypothetical protein